MTPLAKFYSYIALAAIVVAVILGGLTYVNHIRNELASSRVEAATQKDKAVTATEQSATQTDAATTADRRAQRDQLSITLHEDNLHAIQSAPGAAAAVDPALNAAGRRGLCGYAAYSDDPGCAGLRGRDPAQLP